MSAVETAEVAEMNEPEVPTNEQEGDCFIRFLLVNGNDFRMDFPKTTTVRSVKYAIIKSKPQVLVELAEKTETLPPEKLDDVRILYLGKFLEDAKSLEVGNQNPTAVHISLKPSAGGSDTRSKGKPRKSGCCVLQ